MGWLPVGSAFLLFFKNRVAHRCLVCCVAAPQAALLRRCADIAAGVTYLHSRNVCHGDLKCENTLLRTGEGLAARSCWRPTLAL